jgi:hypothetical protein
MYNKLPQSMEVDGLYISMLIASNLKLWLKVPILNVIVLLMLN